MAPSIWMINYTLLCVLNPTVAAQMPGWGDADPSRRRGGDHGEPHGQVPYGDFESSFPG